MIYLLKNNYTLLKNNKLFASISLITTKREMLCLQSFFRVNMISFCLALLYFIPIQLMANVYRFARLSGIDTGIVNIIISCTILIGFIVMTGLLIFLNLKWFEKRRFQYWSLLLWLPYTFLLSYLNSIWFPITYPGDTPNPVTGLLIIGGIVIFPIYIFSISSVTWMRD